MKKSCLILSFFFSSILNLLFNNIIIKNDKVFCESISNFYSNDSIYLTSVCFLIINYLLIMTIFTIVLCLIKKKKNDKNCFVLYSYNYFFPFFLFEYRFFRYPKIIYSSRFGLHDNSFIFNVLYYKFHFINDIK